jgi:hypothetical protein
MAYVSNKQIELLLNKYDIEGMIEHGAPVDEYQNEAKAFTLSLNEMNFDEINIRSIQAILFKIWEMSFNLDQNDLQKRSHNIQRLAEAIYKEIS